MDDALLKPVKVKCSVKIGSPWVWDDEWQDYVEKTPDVTAVGSLVEVKDPRALRAREFRADMVHGPDSTNEDITMCDLAPALEAVLNGTDSLLLVAGVENGGQAELMDGGEGLAAAAVWQLAHELHERQANHRTNGAVGYTYHMRLQSFQLAGDTILDLLTDSLEAARLVELPVGVVAEGVRTASATSADEFMKYVEGAQRRRDPSTRQHSSTFYIIDVTQADYHEGWGLHGQFMLVESAVMDCLAEDKGLVQLREGYDRYRGVYHMRSLVKSWKKLSETEVGVNGSSLTWLLRELFTGGSVEAHVLFYLGQGTPAVSIALMELMEDFNKVQTNPVTHDHRVTGWARAMRAERLSLKQAERSGVDKDTRSLIHELEKRLATAERVKEEAQRVADARQERAHAFQDRYVTALENQESMNEKLIEAEEEQLKAMQSLVEAQMEASEVRDECSEMQYMDNVLLMMLEQEVADLKEAAEEQMGVQAKSLEEVETSVEDLRARNDALSEAKLQVESQKNIERGDLENRIRELQLQLREGHLAESVQHVEEKRKIEESKKEEVERLRQVMEDERSRARQVIDDGELAVRRQIQKEKEEIQNELMEERQRMEATKEQHQREAEAALEEAKRNAEEESQEVQRLRREDQELREGLTDEQQAERRARQQHQAAMEDLQSARRDFHKQLLQIAESPPDGPDAPARNAAVDKLRGQLTAAGQRELEFQGQLDAAQDKVVDLQRNLRRVCRAALDWAPVNADDQRARIEMALESAGGDDLSQKPLVIGLSRAQELQKELNSLQDQLVRQRQEVTLLRGQHESEIQRREEEKVNLQVALGQAEAALHQSQATLQDARAKAVAAEDALASAETKASSASGERGRLSQIQDRLLEEVQSLRNAPQFAAHVPANADLQEQNRSLQARVAFLEQQSPPDKRAQAQRLAFLEKSVRSLEAERSELLVRATVAEEQLKQLQKHLKEMMEDYQMQIMNLKLKVKG